MRQLNDLVLIFFVIGFVVLGIVAAVALCVAYVVGRRVRGEDEMAEPWGDL